MTFTTRRLLETGLNRKLMRAHNRLQNPSSRMRNPNTVFSTVLSTKQVSYLQQLGNEELLITTSPVIISDQNVFFLTDDHTFTYEHDSPSKLASSLIPVSFRMGMRVEPRPGVESGLIQTVEQLLEVFENPNQPGARRQLQSIEELVDYLNGMYPESFDQEKVEQDIREDRCEFHTTYVCPACGNQGFFGTFKYHELMGKNPQSAWHGKGFQTGEHISYCSANQHIPGVKCSHHWKRDPEIDKLHFRDVMLKPIAYEVQTA